MFTVNRNPEAEDLRGFGWAMLIGFTAIAVVVWLLGWRRGASPGLLTWTGSGSQIAAAFLFLPGVGLFLLARFSPAAARPVYIGWMTVMLPIGIVMSCALLTVLFVFLLPVFSLIVRLGDPMRRRLGGATYWEDYRPHEPTLERMRRPF